MNLNFLCCIGAEQKHDQSGMLKMNQVYFYRAYADENMTEILKDNFFNHSESHLKENDIILVYSPNETELPKMRWIRITIPQGGLVRAELVDNYRTLDISFNDDGMEVFIGDNLRDAIAMADEFIRTLRTDHDDLGQQVLEIEAKIPESASEYNPLVTKKELNDAIMSSLTFKGFIGTSQPTQLAQPGNIWINLNSLPASFPVSASIIKQWNGSSWVSYGADYSPLDFDFFRNNNDNEGYYWFGGEWKVMSTDLSAEYFDLNQVSGKWEIKKDVNLPGKPTVDTASLEDDKAIVNVDFLKSNTMNQSMITNCITEIPQDIKLELNNGTLTLKAGSKIYVPNGPNNFDEVIIENDISAAWGYNDKRILCYKNGVFGGYPYEDMHSGTTAPSSSQWMTWYDTVNNVVKQTSDGGATWDSGWSLPFCYVTSGDGQFVSIDQVFNGFGYIGSTKYVLPGVKGLIPNGRNADGSLNNKEFTTSSVMIFTGGSTDSVIGFFNGTTTENYRASSTTYNKELNRNIYTAGGVELDMIPYTNIYHQTAGKIDYCTFKKPFHAVDYNDTGFIANQAMPSHKYLALTIGAVASAYTAPADGYFVCVISGAGYVELQNPITEISSSTNVASGGWGRAFLPVSKGQQIIINYGNNPTFQHFRFVFANGAQ